VRHQTTTPQLKGCGPRQHRAVPLQPKGPLPKVVKHRDYTGRIVISCLAVIAFAMFMGWYSKTSQPNTTLETTKSIPKSQSTVMEGLTPEQIELLKAERDAMALPVAEPPPKKKKWAQ
jgi:hypothetical protein